MVQDYNIFAASCSGILPVDSFPGPCYYSVSFEMAEQPKFGATGQFPRGRLNPEDEGELAVGIIADIGAKVVVMDFNEPITWLAFPPVVARNLAQLLIEKANEIEPIV